MVTLTGATMDLNNPFKINSYQVYITQTVVFELELGEPERTLGL